MAQAGTEPIEEFCGRVLDDPVRGAADILRIGQSGDDAAIRAALVRLLPDMPDPDLALIHMERYCRQGAPPSDIESFHSLLVTFGYSPYLAESLIRDRGFLADLLRARRQGAWGVEEYRNEIAKWLRIRHGSDPWDVLRVAKRRATLCTTLKDLLRLTTLPEVCREISCAADALIQAGLEIVMDEMGGMFGTPQIYDNSGRTVPAGLAVLALGKLGGVELNYSSDVDLLFVHAGDGETSGLDGRPETQITNKEFFTRAAENLTRGLAHIGPEGQVFRVDCRLRPGGRDGDLVIPLQAALAYYGTWARPWERQALIKARVCAGDAELGRQFIQEVEAIVYPVSPDPGLSDGIRGMKDRIDADLASRPEGRSHIKLGRGGIREIEFIVQAMQLLHGAAEPWIREAGTLLAMHRLADKGYLSVSEYGTLSAAYVFLRELEHRIQLPRNLQRSMLPRQNRELRMLARAMGYRDSVQRQEAASLLADLEAHRGEVRGIYDSVFGKLSQRRLEDAPAPDPFLDPMSDTEVVACLRAADVHAGAALLGSVKAIAKLLSATEGPRREFRRMSPILIEELSRVSHPVRALRNMERFIESLALDRGRIARFAARPELIPPVVRLFGGSQPLASILIHRPRLVLEEGFEGAISRERGVSDHLARLLAGIRAASDEESASTFLRVYQRTQLLYIGLRDLSRQEGSLQIEHSLSDLAEAILRVALGSCARATGWPVEDGEATPGFLVMGLGKLGYREMDYFSDLDLVFLYEAGPPDVAAERHAAANRLAGLIMQTLTSITREGSLYAVDVRLRPFGAEGELAQPAGILREYFSASAGVWEMQSFLKARPVAGDLALGRETIHDMEEFILHEAAEMDLSRAVRDMKSRLEREAESRGAGRTDIKLGPGGLSAIQFAIQYLQLRHGIPSPPHKRTTRLLESLRTAGLLDEEAHAAFFTGFQFLRELEHRMRLIHGRAVSRVPESREAQEELAAAMGFFAQTRAAARERLLQDLATHRSRIEATYRRVIEDAARPEAVTG